MCLPSSHVIVCKPRPVSLKLQWESPLQCTGKLLLKVKIGGAEVSHVDLVPNISTKFILGLDFLMAYGCSVDTGLGSLRIVAKEMPLHKPLAFQVARCHQVVAMEDTVISPYSEILVPTKIIGEPYGEPWGTVGPSATTTLPPSVMLRKTLVDAQRDYIPGQMVNLTNEPRHCLWYRSGYL